MKTQYIILPILIFLIIKKLEKMQSKTKTKGSKTAGGGAGGKTTSGAGGSTAGARGGAAAPNKNTKESF